MPAAAAIAPRLRRNARRGVMPRHDSSARCKRVQSPARIDRVKELAMHLTRNGLRARLAGASSLVLLSAALAAQGRGGVGAPPLGPPSELKFRYMGPAPAGRVAS